MGQFLYLKYITRNEVGALLYNCDHKNWFTDQECILNTKHLCLRVVI